MNFTLPGWKTYIGGVIVVGIGVLKGMSIDVPGFEDQSPGTLISMGMMFIFTRLGIAKMGG